MKTALWLCSLMATLLAVGCGGSGSSGSPYEGSWLMGLNCNGNFSNLPFTVDANGNYGVANGAVVFTGSISNAGVVSGTATNAGTYCASSTITMSGSCATTSFCSGSVTPPNGPSTFSFHR